MRGKFKLCTPQAINLYELFCHCQSTIFGHLIYANNADKLLVYACNLKWNYAVRPAGHAHCEIRRSQMIFKYPVDTRDLRRRQSLSLRRDTRKTGRRRGLGRGRTDGRLSFTFITSNPIKHLILCVIYLLIGWRYGPKEKPLPSSLGGWSIAFVIFHSACSVRFPCPGKLSLPRLAH